MLVRLKKLIYSKNVLELRKIIDELNENDLAELLSDLSYDDLAKVFRIIPKDKAVAVFAEFDVVVATNLLRQLSESETVNLIDEMYADDATDILEEMPANIVDKILKNCSDETRKDINKLLKYEEDTAGSIMTVEYVEFNGQTTVKEAVSQLENEITYFETINNCYVVDHKRKLYGSIEATDLLFANENDTIKNVCKTNIIYVSTYTDQEEVAKVFSKYGYILMPVIDVQHHLLGVIDIDDVMDVIEEETTEDMNLLGGVGSEERLDSTLTESFKNRIPWLIVNLFTAIMASSVVSVFEGTIAKVVALATISPIITGMGGNAGSQTQSILVRQLSQDDVSLRKYAKSFIKEIMLGVVDVAINGLITGIIVSVIYHNIYLGLIIFIAMIGNLVVAGVFGFLVPVALKRLGADPAVSSSIFITTATDVLGFFIFLGLAQLFLPLLM